MRISACGSRRRTIGHRSFLPHMKIIYFMSILWRYDNLSIFRHIYNEIQNKYQIYASCNELPIRRKLKGIITVCREIAPEKWKHNSLKKGSPSPRVAPTWPLVGSPPAALLGRAPLTLISPLPEEPIGEACADSREAAAEHLAGRVGMQISAIREQHRLLLPIVVWLLLWWPGMPTWGCAAWGACGTRECC